MIFYNTSSIKFFPALLDKYKYICVCVCIYTCMCVCIYIYNLLICRIWPCQKPIPMRMISVALKKVFLKS